MTTKRSESGDARGMVRGDVAPERVAFCRYVKVAHRAEVVARKARGSSSAVASMAPRRALGGR